MRVGARIWIKVALGAGALMPLGLALMFADASAQVAVPTPKAAQPAQPAAALAAPMGNAERGAIVFRSSCGLCHRDPKQFSKRFKGADPRVRGIPLEDYLATHNPPQPGPKRDLIAYLKAL